MNYQHKESDIKYEMRFPSTAGAAQVAKLEVEFYTDDTASVIARWDGTDAGFTNCVRVNPYTFVLTFADHGLAAGVLKAHSHVWFADAQMPGGKLKVVDDLDCGIELLDEYDGTADDGDDLVRHDMLSAVKPVCGVDYYTDAEKLAFKTAILTELKAWLTDDETDPCDCADAQIAAAVEQITAANGRIDTNEANITSAVGRISQNESTITALNASLAEKQTAITDLQTHVDNLDTQVTGSGSVLSRIADLERVNLAQSNIIESMEFRLNALENA